MSARFDTDGRLVLSVMLGPYDRHPVGSREWAEGLTMHLQSSLDHLQRDSNPRRVLRILRDALTANPHPWQVYPEEAKGNPETWLRMATLLSWSELQAQVERLDPKGWAEIAAKQSAWEADPEHGRKPGAPAGNQNAAKDKEETTVSDTDDCSRDQESARGIRRRLQKRANAGDEQAAELVSQLTAGDISVNQAAIAAGMRQQYIRVRTDDPAKAAASIVERMGAEWAGGLAMAIAEAVAERTS